jgi:exopolysaccharide production protein ExoZ
LKFLIERVLRIAPAYWFVTILIVLWRLQIGDSLSWTSVATSFLFLQLNSDFISIPILPVGWTLNYEITFYALVFATRRKYIFFLLTIYIVFCFGVNALFFVYFIIGILLAVLFEKFSLRNSLSVSKYFLALLILLFAIVNMQLSFPEPTIMERIILYGPLAAGIVMVSACVDLKLEFSGNMSYYIYLFHQPLLGITNLLSDWFVLVEVPLVVLLSGIYGKVDKNLREKVLNFVYQR